MCLDAATPGDGVCETVNNTCTLRAAIEEANALTSCGTIDINFATSGPMLITLGGTQLTIVGTDIDRALAKYESSQNFSFVDLGAGPMPANSQTLSHQQNNTYAAFGQATYNIWQQLDLTAGLRELRRVARGPVVVLTGDGDALDRLWLAEYAPALIAAVRGDEVLERLVVRDGLIHPAHQLVDPRPAVVGRRQRAVARPPLVAVDLVHE